MGRHKRMEIPQVNLVMQAEQWKARLQKEEESYIKGREIRQKETEHKIRDCRTRLANAPNREGSSMGRPPTSISSVCFDSAGRPNTQQTMKTQSTSVSMTSTEYRNHMDKMDRLESN